MSFLIPNCNLNQIIRNTSYGIGKVFNEDQSENREIYTEIIDNNVDKTITKHIYRWIKGNSVDILVIYLASQIYKTNPFYKTKLWSVVYIDEQISKAILIESRKEKNYEDIAKSITKNDKNPYYI